MSDTALALALEERHVALMAEVARLRQWLTLRLEDRLVDHLASLPGEMQPDGSRKLVRPPSQKEMGKVIGCARESVCRAVNSLRRYYAIVYGQTDTNRPTVMYLSPGLLARAEQIRSER